MSAATIIPDLFNWSSFRPAQPQPAQAAPAPAPAVSRRTCPISARGAITGPTADIQTLVVDLHGREVLL
jgi:hypothetical protein